MEIRAFFPRHMSRYCNINKKKERETKIFPFCYVVGIAFFVLFVRRATETCIIECLDWTCCTALLNFVFYSCYLYC